MRAYAVALDGGVLLRARAYNYECDNAQQLSLWQAQRCREAGWLVDASRRVHGLRTVALATCGSEGSVLEPADLMSLLWGCCSSCQECQSALQLAALMGCTHVMPGTHFELVLHVLMVARCIHASRDLPCQTVSTIHYMYDVCLQ
jgi:hypothetical protein